MLSNLEIGVMMRLRHPRIVTFLGTGEGLQECDQYCRDDSNCRGFAFYDGTGATAAQTGHSLQCMLSSNGCINAIKNLFNIR